ncbi:uncharacterized protein LOC126313383 [Schistocerca gregaria]|uniref:uncharacterized protein LOC126313383 n=1 Tax=Schistocerca gregaria TaxID=7010 RepID=UPI00211E5D78|nr:uncharacterized protein LOC126313383 [Schistocerca gregaria]
MRIRGGSKREAIERLRALRERTLSREATPFRRRAVTSSTHNEKRSARSGEGRASVLHRGPSAQQAEFSRYCKLANPLLSEIELGDQLPKVQDFVDLDRDAWNLDDLAPFVIDSLSSVSVRKAGGGVGGVGSPLAIVVVRSAVRALEVCRRLRALGSRWRVAKLFAKHKKIEEQIGFLQRHRCEIAVGTPARMAELAGRGYLRFDELRLLAVDMDRDVKGMSVLDLFDTRRAFFELYGDFVCPLVKGGRVKVCMF